jgi:2-keto-4-pentenoate hydratase
MDKSNIEYCGKALYEAFITKKPIEKLSLKFPNELDIETAYEIQKCMLEYVEKDGRHPAGHKIGLTSKAMRELVNINEPDYGRIYFEDCYCSNSEIKCSDFIYPRIEAEILFKLKSDLNKPNITFEDVVEAVEYFVPAFEIIDNRYHIEGQLISDSIADNAANGAYVVGDKPCYIENMDYARNISYQGIILEKNGYQIDTSTCAAVMGNPINAVCWLANKMYEKNDPLLKGELVLSGSIIAAVEVKKGDYFRCDYGQFGSVDVHFV